MKRILLALDFTEASRNALTYTRQLAALSQAELHVLHVARPLESPTTLSEAMREQVLKVNEEALKGKLLRMATPYPHQTDEATKPLSIHYQVRTGDTISTLLAQAQEIQASLLVIGIRKKHNIWEQLLGSTCTQMLKRSEIPLLLIPEAASFKGHKQMALALDPESDFSKIILLVKVLLNEWPLALAPFYVDTLPENQDLYKEERQVVAAQEWTIVRDRSVAAGIRYFIEKHPCEILALHLPKRALIEQLMHGKLSRHLAFHTDIPLLVF